jgi:hypothetical protein
LDALTVLVHDAKVVLCPGKALLGGFAIPLRRLDIVLRYALASLAAKTEMLQITVRYRFIRGMSDQ